MAATTAERPLAAGEPRIAPGSRAQIGRVNALIAAVIGAHDGHDGAAADLFTTLARHRSLFRPLAAVRRRADARREAAARATRSS